MSYFRLWKHFRGLLRKYESIFFFLFIIVHLIPVWAFEYFPSQDGPCHINNANIILGYNNPAHSVFREYYVLNKNIEPTWFGHLILAALMYIVPILVAEKIFLSGYIILFPISIRYVLRAIHPGAEFLSILAFPFIYNYVLHMGFYSFSYSIPVCFFVVGYWVKNQDRLSIRKIIILAFLLLLLYLFHIVSLMMAYTAIILMTLWLAFYDLFYLSTKKRKQQLDLQALWRGFKKRALMPIYAFLPAFVFVIIFLYQRKTGVAPSPPFWTMLEDLINISSIVSYSKTEGLLSKAIVVFFTAIFIYHIISKVVRHEKNPWDGIFIIVVAYTAIYFLAPNTYIISTNGMYGGEFIKQRLNFYPFLAMILWFGAQSYHINVKKIIYIVSVGISVIVLGLHITKYAELNNYIEEYLSGTNLIESNTTLLPICFSKKGRTPDGRLISLKIMPFLHAAGHIAAQKNVVTLNNYEANTGYFPILYRPNLNPYIQIVTKGKMDDKPPWVDFITYPQRTGGHVDYVLIWGIRKEQIDTKAARSGSILYQLKKNYKLIYISPQRGLMQLYRCKTWENKLGKVH